LFYNDLLDAEQLTLEAWQQRGILKLFPEKIARLFSPLL
jgi:hypothetical protein